VNAAATADITAGIVILDDAGMVTDSCAWYSNWYE